VGLKAAEVGRTMAGDIGMWHVLDGNDGADGEGEVG
jgi:hypothetical protein